MHLQFSIPFQSRVGIVTRLRLRSLGRRLLMTATNEPKPIVPRSALCICLRKMENKTNRSNISRDLNGQVLIPTGCRRSVRLGGCEKHQSL